MRSWRREMALATTGAEMDLPARPRVASSADMWLSRMPLSEVLMPAIRSLTRGSTRVIMVTSCARPCTERARTTLECSLSDLTKVVCSWGRKGFIMIPPFCSSSSSVRTIAALTCHGKRSPMMRIRGPLICTTIGFSAAALVACTSSPSPSAACSRVSGVAPCMSACRKKGRIGASPLLLLKPVTPPAAACVASCLTSSRTTPTCTPQLTLGAFASSFFSDASMCPTSAASAVCAAARTGSSSAPKRCTRPLTMSGLKSSKSSAVPLQNAASSRADDALVWGVVTSSRRRRSSKTIMRTPSCGTASTTFSAASAMASGSSPSSIPSESAPRMVGMRGASSLPATDASAPSALALAAVMGGAVRTGMRKGRTILPRTLRSWRRPSRALEESSSSFSSSAGTISSMARCPIALKSASKAMADAPRTSASGSQSAMRIVETTSSR
mmetsp:Transcript_60076/g.141730  ORF Transcript_60076/g.141730 Transcript_60076/m.141730 type:complete len:442 (-) Transcript_60076:1499-2824(-)